LTKLRVTPSASASSPAVRYPHFSNIRFPDGPRQRTDQRLVRPAFRRRPGIAAAWHRALFASSELSASGLCGMDPCEEAAGSCPFGRGEEGKGAR
jgi:hypothetical protein